MKFDNYMILDFPSKSSNEAFARSAVACFAAQLDPTMEEMGDIRTAVSEAVTNAAVPLCVIIESGDLLLTQIIPLLHILLQHIFQSFLQFEWFREMITTSTKD